MVAANGCVADRRRRSADHSPLGAALQRPRNWSMGSHRGTLEAQRRRALAEVVEAGPVPAGMSWRRKDLGGGSVISLDETIGRELKALGRKISARPRHYAQNELAVEAFKKNFPAGSEDPGGPERRQLWWQDEARIGQKNKGRGTRPRAPRDQRTEWAYIFGASVPRRGKAPGWSCPPTPAPHPVPPSIPAPKLAQPVPPRSPELNPVENVAIHARQFEPDLQILRRHRLCSSHGRSFPRIAMGSDQ